jgi:hypothetical protein
MTTSKPSKIVFFAKEDCAPCLNTKDALNDVLRLHPEYNPLVTVLQKENHSALVAAYELDMYPTVIIFDEEMNELSRRIGQRNLTYDWWLAALTSIYNRRLSENK